MTTFPDRKFPFDPDETPDPGDIDQPPDEVTRRDRPTGDRRGKAPARSVARCDDDDLFPPTQPMLRLPDDADDTGDESNADEADEVAAPTRPTASGSGRRPEPDGSGRGGRPPVNATGCDTSRLDTSRFGTSGLGTSGLGTSGLDRAGLDRAGLDGTGLDHVPGRAVEGAARPGVPAVQAGVPGAAAVPARPGGRGPSGFGGGPALPNPFEEPPLPQPVGWTAGSADFWSALTSVERMCFLRFSEPEVLPAGHVLWRQDEPAGHIAVLWSGKVTIRVREKSGERIVAVRGPGDLIGERAALMVPRRSATVVALDRLTVLRMPVGEFAAFLTAFPRLLAVLDQQLYARLTQPPAQEDRHRQVAAGAATVPIPVPAARGSVPPPARRRPSTTLDWAGTVCSIMFVDVVGFSAEHRNDTDRMELRRVLYEAVPDALEGSNVPWAACYHEDRGDGMLIVVPPQAPPARVVDPMLSLLTARLRRHNHAASEAMRLRVRMSLHIGPVMPDREGVNGSAIIQAARLLDAPELRHRMADTEADVGFIASDYVYQYVLAQGPGYINPRSFQRIRFRAKNAAYTGWMHLSQSTF
ncbi:cyclic nucleotide-binding domain-containing protein [Actinomadura harenae]|nr:cyclic nucleotide-binding domain-containing protein [Actinomadura harenae]